MTRADGRPVRLRPGTAIGVVGPGVVGVGGDRTQGRARRRGRAGVEAVAREQAGVLPAQPPVQGNGGRVQQRQRGTLGQTACQHATHGRRGDAAPAVLGRHRHPADVLARHAPPAEPVVGYLQRGHGPQLAVLDQAPVLAPLEPLAALGALLGVDDGTEGDLPQPQHGVEVADAQRAETAVHPASPVSPGAGGQVQGADPQRGQPAA